MGAKIRVGDLRPRPKRGLGARARDDHPHHQRPMSSHSRKLARKADMVMRRAGQAVRPVVWSHPDYPGFGGTCFLVHLFGSAFAITARHVLGSTEPDNFSIPRAQADGPMRLIHPTNIVWYNAGDFDHVSDIAVAALPELPPGAMNIAGIKAMGAENGEQLYALGYPKSFSSVSYEVDATPGWQGKLYRDLGVTDLFVWNCVRLSGACTRPPSLQDLGEIRLRGVPAFATLDGMSGSPVFAMRAGHFEFVGMIARGGGDPPRAWFVDGVQILHTLTRSLVRDQRIAETLRRLLKDQGNFRQFANYAGGFLVSLFQGDRDLAMQVMTEWLDGHGSVLELAFGRAQAMGFDALAPVIGDEAAEMLSYLVRWRQELRPGP